MNYFDEQITMDAAVKKYKLSKRYIMQLIKIKYIHAFDPSKYGDKSDIIIDPEGVQKLQTLSEHPEYRKKILDFNPSAYYDYCPELINYHPFHDFLDRYCWLIKLFYSDTDNIKKKKYRLDVLFQNFISKNNFSLEKLSDQLKTTKGNEAKIIFHLQKGWYNELARSLPLNPEYLKIGTDLKGSVADSTSVSWNITQTYYSVYEYTNSLAFIFNKKIDTAQHRKSTNIFNNSVLNTIKKNVFFYPFFLSSQNTSPGKYPIHSKYKYASYPRDITKNIESVNKDVIKAFKRLSKENNDTPVSLVDFLFEFRVWANYTGVDTIIKLKNGHLLEYLYKNLGIINFFTGGISELAVIAKLGEEKYIEVFKEFANDYILEQPQFVQNILLIPIFIRHRIYKNLGIISTDLPFLSSMYNDPVIIVNPNQKPEKYDPTELLAKISNIPISGIAEIIIDDWKKQGKIPDKNLKAMLTFKTLDDAYGADSASAVISYFLSGANSWKGDAARTIKKYLIKLLNKQRKKDPNYNKKDSEDTQNLSNSSDDWFTNSNF